jgi:hypothetical protein
MSAVVSLKCMHFQFFAHLDSQRCPGSPSGNIVFTRDTVTRYVRI